MSKTVADCKIDLGGNTMTLNEAIMELEICNPDFGQVRNSGEVLQWLLELHRRREDTVVLVEDILEMLHYGDKFALFGARTGKKLYDPRYNKKKNLEQFMECRASLSVDIIITKDCNGHITNCLPRLCVWVYGK